MASQRKEPAESKAKDKLARIAHRDHKVEHIFRRILHTLERIVATLTLLALIAALCLEVWHCICDVSYFSDINTLLHNILTIVVGLEFVRMLIDTTPTNILEVLMVAITRHVIISHDDPWSNLACVACIAGLFAIRRFLVRRNELKEEMLEDD